MPNETTRVAAIQMQCGTDPQANLEKAVARVREAAAQGAQIICLPELFRSQYFCQSEDHANFELAEEIPGPSTERLSAVECDQLVTRADMKVARSRVSSCRHDMVAERTLLTAEAGIRPIGFRESVRIALGRD